MFSVDRMTVGIVRGLLFGLVEGVTQLLSTKTLKEKVGKVQLVRSELVEELSSLLFLPLSSSAFFFSLVVVLSSCPPCPSPILLLFIATGLFIEVLGGERAP